MNPIPPASPKRNATPGSHDRSRIRSERGSVLMVAMIIGAVIAISLTSYINLSLHSAKMANRSFYMDGAQNLADIGLEQVLWSMNNKNWVAGNFALRSGTTTQYQGTFPSSTGHYPFAAGVKGQVKVWVDLANPRRPHVISQATITLNDGSTLAKTAEAYLKEKSYFDDGMVGDTITFKGKVTIDSWNSDPDNSPSTPAIPYSSAVARDGGKVGATSVIVSALSGGQGQIAGSVYVGSSESGGGVSLGAQGSVGDFAWVSGGNYSIQEGHATYDFIANFPDVSAPTPPTGTTVYPLAGSIVTLPRRNAAGAIVDARASDGHYYYTIPEISLTGTNDVMIVDGGKVIVTTTNTSGQTVKATGASSGIIIKNGSALKIYTAGDVAVTGSGILNGGDGINANTANQPIAFQLYGTRSAATASTSGDQSWDIKGNGYLSGVIYAPNADVHMNGNAPVLGAIVGDTVLMDGNAAFHFDESLQDNLVTGLWKLVKWRELTTPAERALYASALTF